MTLSYGRALRSERPHYGAPTNRGKSISIISAISNCAVQTALYGNWATNGEIFTQFIENGLVPNLQKGDTVIMDNISFHKSVKIQELVESAGASVLLLPPYSPELNPIEKMWSKIKQILRECEPRSMKEFQRAINLAFSEITVPDLKNWYKACGYASK